LVGSDFRCFLFYAEGKPWCIENGFIAVEPGNGLIAGMIRNLERNLVQYRDKRRFRGIWADTGPGLATETIMSALARYILTGEDASLVEGFLTSRNDLCAISYRHDELQYMQTAEGNWRKARLPGIASGPT
jgi:inositol phosphorylceramide mannosyltransferase catalytic subunit